MLKKNYRLSDKRSFKKIWSKGLFLKGKFVILKFVFLNREQNSKFAITVSKKTAAKAIDRNKIKRQISHIVEKLIPSLKRNIEMNIIVKQIPSNFDELDMEINNLFRQALIITIT
ncbi:ribonuclease P protein component [Candidatus Berkelbacteria bacterium RIFCSPHIGHO2_12_FULL_36_9]|uniref:Ribonuclease P protein component n=1 Tax=Candidatus Berkelbacteria bacterium RIFCSPHIGHO2_12_FULL_36_9 TaxID=1797469 RepID=A0A1F5EFP9_9BACT|nr:MAG: ribonuclease P protein component [Candidatus Berkelbacteria bacterium RIFCSPHIGHO2_12_FULL_36_9]